MTTSTNVSEAEMMSSTAAPPSVSLPKVVEHALSSSKTVVRNVSRAILNSSSANEGPGPHMGTPAAKRRMCGGMIGAPRREHTPMHGFNGCEGMQGEESNGVQAAALSGSPRSAQLPSWTPFAAWLIALLLFSVLAAAMTYRFLRSRRLSREEYEELVDAGGSATAAVDDTRGKTRLDGNASRQRFLQSRRAAAQKSYGTETPTK
ncbi:uncharacterized protein Tco025E_00934 [Trypanosoma conorhini]|uniref:Uncharacterized protein n=1 Tax=Trypanosoma conorhini TaxID=83891 RepID=A0A3R7LEK5_9TRYP|nr:uncharacterized protein Tco025E_00934 [Trypanosoma conorhini]RNF26852.1 hypothetical protein Tco025E_00934 [Trypanosoma conorhini]